MTSPAMTTETVESLTAVVRLLHQASRRADERALGEGGRSYWHLIGWGVHLAALQAVDLLPPEILAEGQAPAERDPVRLLDAAIELAATIAVGQRPSGLPVLLAALRDLAREAHAHAC